MGPYNQVINEVTTRQGLLRTIKSVKVVVNCQCGNSKQIFSDFRRKYHGFYDVKNYITVENMLFKN